MSINYPIESTELAPPPPPALHFEQNTTNKCYITNKENMNIYIDIYIQKPDKTVHEKQVG